MLKPNIVPVVNAENFYKNFGIYIFIIAVIMWSLFITDILADVWKVFLRIYSVKKLYYNVRKLNSKQQEIVRELYNDDNGHSGYYQSGDSDILYLHKINIVVRASKHTPIYDPEDIRNPTFLYVLSPIVVKYCDKHSDNYSNVKKDEAA